MVDDDILRFYISVHDSNAVGVVESFQYLVNIEFAVMRFKYLEQFSVLGGSHVLHHQAKHFSFLYNVEQLDAVVASSEGHQNFNLPVYFSKFDCMGKDLLGLSILTTHFSEFWRLTDSKTSEYFPLPIFLSQA